jgi:hypothetical protein
MALELLVCTSPETVSDCPVRVAPVDIISCCGISSLASRYGWPSSPVLEEVSERDVRVQL